MEDRPLRLVLIGPLPPPFGGMANQTCQLARLLADEGIEVLLVQTNSLYRPKWLERIRFVRALGRFVVYVGELRRALRGAELAHLMANSGWSWHLFAAPAIWLASMAGVPLLVNYRGGDAGAFLARQVAWVRPSLRLVCGLLVPSGFLRNVFRHHGFEAEIVPNILDLGRFTPAPPRAFGWHFLVARNLEDIYDVPTALRAFAQIRAEKPSARLTVAGSGPALSKLRRLVEELGLETSVRFGGRLSNESMAALFQEADLLLNSSIVDNMPISLLEAMASGVPIVSTDVGGIPYLVQHEHSALLVPVRSPDAMARAALRLAADAALRRRLVASGLAAAQEYSWESVGPRLRQVYERCAGRRVAFGRRDGSPLAKGTTSSHSEHA